MTPDQEKLTELISQAHELIQKMHQTQVVKAYRSRRSLVPWLLCVLVSLLVAIYVGRGN